MNVTRDDFLPRLRKAYPGPAGGPFDLAAALDAIAGVESNWDVRAVGDTGNLQTGPSVGAWAVNLPTYVSTGILPTYDPPADDSAALDYEIEWMRPVVADKLREVAKVFSIWGARAGSGEPVDYSDADLAALLSYVWQWSPAHVESWAQSTTSSDPTTDTSMAGYLQRAQDFIRYYANEAEAALVSSASNTAAKLSEQEAGAYASMLSTLAEMRNAARNIGKGAIAISAAEILAIVVGGILLVREFLKKPKRGRA